MDSDQTGFDGIAIDDDWNLVITEVKGTSVFS
jgi:hypothetical protein